MKPLSPTQAYALEIADRLCGLRPVSVTRFFGGMGLRAGGVQFAFVMKGSLYLRVDEEMRAMLEAIGGTPFVYQGASGAVNVTRYSAPPASVLEDDDELQQWAMKAYRAAVEAALPAAKQRRKHP